jgi:hypothetical protein
METHARIILIAYFSQNGTMREMAKEIQQQTRVSDGARRLSHFLPRMEDETRRRHLFAAIDRATRRAYLEVKERQNAQSGQSRAPEASRTTAPKLLRTASGKS